MSPFRALVLIALLATPLFGCAAPTVEVDLTAERDALHDRSQALVEAEEAMDTEAALAFWAPDAVVHPAGAPQMQGHDAIRNLYDSFFAGGVLRSFESTMSHLELAASGDLAYEYGVNRMVLAGPEGDVLDVGKYMGVWKKIDGEWYVVAVSFSSDAPEPAPMAVL